jgi:hypothetical protein
LYDDSRANLNSLRVHRKTKRAETFISETYQLFTITKEFKDLSLLRCKVACKNRKSGEKVKEIKLNGRSIRKLSITKATSRYREKSERKILQNVVDKHVTKNELAVEIEVNTI